MAFTFRYSGKFEKMVRDMQRGREKLPFFKGYIPAHLGGPGSNIDMFCSDTYPEIRYHCGSIAGKRVLDFGCGTGATTAVLAMHGGDVTAFDIDERSMEICRERVREHGVGKRVRFLRADSFDAVAGKAGKFDLIVVNAVLEHVPLSRRGLRKGIVRTLFGSLRKGGFLFISGTPNRLWPIDMHTTGLWWIPWHSPGSVKAYRKAVGMGKHMEGDPACSPGPLGLEERGAWGATFFEIRGYLSGKSFEIVNTKSGHDRHLSYTRARASRKRRYFDFLVYFLLAKWAGIPITALAPSIENLAIKKK